MCQGGAEGDGKKGAVAKQRHKSMSQEKEEKNQRIAAVRQAQAEEQQLGDFIRLADYMCVSIATRARLASCEKLLDDDLTTPRKNGLWITSVEYGEDDMMFSPPLKTFTASLAQMLELMVSNIHAVPRFALHAALQALLPIGPC